MPKLIASSVRNAIVSTRLIRMKCVREGSGGVVHGWFGGAQLQRLIDHGLKVTIAVDKVASGGYMMPVGNNILSAPFAFTVRLV